LENTTMRFLMLVKGRESGTPLPPEFVAAMARHGAEAKRAGRLLETGHLAPSAQGMRVRVAGGKPTVVDGPFAESKEVVGGFGLVELGSREEALAAAQWLAQQNMALMPGWEGEVEVREVLGEPEGLG
jgi:hypothetical protein